MSEESRFFDEEQRKLDRKWDTNYRNSWISIFALLGGGGVAASFHKQKPAFISGLIVSAAGAIGLATNYFLTKGLHQEGLDIDAAKVGLLPKEELHKRHVILSLADKEDLKAASRKELEIQNRANSRMSAGDVWREAENEKALAAAREEWQKRVQARAQEPTNKTR